MLTLFSNIFNFQNLTDAHTCYKAFDGELFRSINLIEDDFSFCPEITTKIGNLKIKIKEVQLHITVDRIKKEKIKLIDGVKALIAIIKYKFFHNE